MGSKAISWMESWIVAPKMVCAIETAKEAKTKVMPKI